MDCIQALQYQNPFLFAAQVELNNPPKEVIDIETPGWNKELKRRVSTFGETATLQVPELSPTVQSSVEVEDIDFQASGTAVKNLFEGNYEQRRQFGVVDIFETLGFSVSVANYSS